MPGPKPEERLATLEERANWHRNVGWTIVGMVGSVFVLLLTWYIPKELGTLRDSVKSDNAIQLEPISEKLARLTAIVELRQSKDVAQVLKNNVDFSQDPKLAVKTLAAIAHQAQAEGIKTNPQVLIDTNRDLKQVAEKHPDLQTVTWAARLELVGYRTSLNTAPEQPKTSTPIFKFPGPLFNGGGMNTGTQSLDNAYWRNFTFENMRITYKGGPMALENVTFINCTFDMSQVGESDKFANTLIAENHVTELFR